MNASNPISKNADEILGEAAAWIERRDREQWGEAEQADLDAWLTRSPANLVAFLRAENAWSRADRLSALRTESRSKSPASSIPSRRRIHIAAALVVTMGLAAGGLVFVTQSPTEKTYTTRVGGHTVLSLADGSKIELNTDTALRIGSDGARRLVQLDRGEAFFDIKHDAAHPFVVIAANHRVIDIGTKFLVRERGKQLEVSLVEGSAKIEPVRSSPVSETAILQKGDVAIATETGLSVQRRASEDISQALSWRRGVLKFDNTTLAEAAVEFNRYNRRKLIVADPAAARLSIAGTFHANDVRAFAEVAEDILHVHVKSNDTDIVISR